MTGARSMLFHFSHTHPPCTFRVRPNCSCLSLMRNSNLRAAAAWSPDMRIFRSNSAASDKQGMLVSVLRSSMYRFQSDCSSGVLSILLLSCHTQSPARATFGLVSPTTVSTGSISTRVMSKLSAEFCSKPTTCGITNRPRFSDCLGNSGRLKNAAPLARKELQVRINLASETTIPNGSHDDVHWVLRHKKPVPICAAPSLQTAWVISQVNWSVRFGK